MDNTEHVGRKAAFETSIVSTCLVAAYPVGITFFDWLTRGWSNLPWQLGGYAALLLIATLSTRWSRRRAVRGMAASESSTDE